MKPREGKPFTQDHTAVAARLELKWIFAFPVQQSFPPDRIPAILPYVVNFN